MAIKQRAVTLDITPLKRPGRNHTFFCGPVSKLDKEAIKLILSQEVLIRFTKEEVLILHAVATMGDGRRSLTKLLKRKFTPLALKILEEHKEL